MNFYGLTVSGGYSLGAPIGDAQFKNTSLLISPSTTQAKSTTTTDSSTNAFTVTRNGNPTTQWPSPYQSTGYWSTQFNGSSYLSLPNNTALDMGSSDFTIEFWFNASSVSATRTIATRFNGNAFSQADIQWTIYQVSATLNLGVYYSSTSATISFTNGIVANTWNHCALVRSGNSIYGYLNGVRSATIPTVTVALTTGAWSTYIGNYVEGGVNYYFVGYVSNFRIVKGTAVYTGATYTLPTAPLTPITNTSLLTLQNNLFKDNSSNNFTITPSGSPQISSLYPLTTINANQGYFSGLFNGANYLSLASNAALAFGTGDFTIEAWIYLTSLSASNTICDNRTADTASAYVFYITSNGTLTFYDGPGGVDRTSSAGAITTNAWYNVVATRSGTTFRLYINGAVATTNTGVSSNFGSSQPLRIGQQVSNLYGWNGYISNLRLVKGTAVYTTNFTPSIIPLRAITNTSLLALQNTTFVDNSTNAFTITATGSPSTNVANPFTTAFPPSNYFPALGAGMYFDGASDYLTAPSSVVSTIGTGAFTIEGWFYSQDFTVRTTYFQRLWSFGNGLANDVTLNIDTSGFLVYRNNDTALITASTAATLNVWYHVALVRSGSTTTIYLNGVSVGTTATSNNLTVQGGYSLYIGNESGSTRGGYFIGYMSNFRVVPGVAVYTGAFTPPSLQPLTTAGSTSALCYTSTTNVNTSFAATSTSLLLNFIDSNLTDGVFNAGQNNTFLDSGPNSFAITRNGTPTQGALTPYIPNGYWSGYFSSSYLSVADNAALEFGSSSFCIEVFYFPTTTPAAQAIFIKQPNPSTDYGFRIIGFNGVLTAYISSGNTSDDIVNGVTFGTLQSNSWNHIAVYRVGTAIYGSLNGTITTLNANTNLSVWNNTGAWVLSASSTGTNPSTGYFSNWRIVVGSSVYTGSSATVPTSPLAAITNTQLLTCQSNRFIDNSSNAFTVTMNGTPSIQAFKPFNPPVAYSPSVYGGSGYFNGSTDYLDELTANTAFNLSSGDWTIEAWIYRNAASANHLILNLYNSAGSNSGLTFYVNSSNQLVTDNGTVAALSGGSVPANQWVHLAIVRSSGTTTGYINGVSIGTNTQAPATAQYARIGLLASSFYYFNGYISNLRIVKGTGIYSGTFTPPILPLSTTGAASVASYSSTTNVNTSFPSTQCSLLTNFINSGITDFTTNNNLTTVGDAKVSTTAAKYGLASFFFDGNGDYLTSINNPGFNLTSGDFTIELWFYCTTITADYQWIINKDGVSGTSYSQYGIGVSPAGKLWVVLGNGNGLSPTQTEYGNATTITLNTWNYVAVVRTVSTIKVFYNGIQVNSTAQVTAMSDGGKSLLIGYQTGQPSSNYFNGYIQDVRITKGYARYLSTFTVPTDSFTQGGGIGSVPGAPTIGTATKTNSTTATVTFTPPANTGGYAITTYTATSSIGNITGTSTTSPITISGLTSGYGYSFTVTATNSLGVSSPSAASNTVGGLAIRSFQITQMDPIYTLNTTITTAIGITKIQSYTMAILYGDD